MVGYPKPTVAVHYACVSRIRLLAYVDFTRVLNPGTKSHPVE